MINKIKFILASLFIALIINFFFLAVLISLYHEAWIFIFILFSFLLTMFLVYKMLRNSELANSDNNMPLERRIKIKKTDLIIEGFIYILVYLLSIGLLATVKSLPFSAVLVFAATALPASFVIFKAYKKKYDAVQELSKTKS